MSKNSDVCVVATVTAEQVFTLFDDAPSQGVVSKDFKSVKATLDPAPPCKWECSKVENVKVSVDKKARTVNRSFSLDVTINITKKTSDAVKEMMEDEGYYDEYDGFDWPNAINSFIADTTVCPDYADFDSENVNVEVMELKS